MKRVEGDGQKDKVKRREGAGREGNMRDGRCREGTDTSQGMYPVGTVCIPSALCVSRRHGVYLICGMAMNTSK